MLKLIAIKLLDLSGEVGVIEVPRETKNRKFNKIIESGRLYLNGEFAGFYGHTIISTKRDECETEDYCIGCDCEHCKLYKEHTEVMYVPKNSVFTANRRQFYVEVYDQELSEWIVSKQCQTFSQAEEYYGLLRGEGMETNEIRIVKEA